MQKGDCGPMKTIIAGMRDFYDYEKVSQAVTFSGLCISEVVSGCATGVDALGEKWARERKIPVRKFPADWRKNGKAAGPIRNRQMAEYAEALVAVWDGKSKGTKNMIETARSLGLQTIVHYV